MIVGIEINYDCEMKNKEEKNEGNVIIKVYKDEETHKFEKKYQTTTKSIPTTIKIKPCESVLVLVLVTTGLAPKPCIGITILKASLKSDSAHPASATSSARISSRVRPLANSARMYPMSSGVIINLIISINEDQKQVYSLGHTVVDGKVVVDLLTPVASIHQ